MRSHINYRHFGKENPDTITVARRLVYHSNSSIDNTTYQQ
jgi:hypothetical protein